MPPPAPLAAVPVSDWLRPSVLALVAANLLPLGGVLFLGWEIFPLVFLFWLENVIMGGFNALKMLLADPAEPAGWVAKAAMIPFFCFHYGMFCFVHGMFVFVLFGRGTVPVKSFPDAALFWQVLTGQHLFWAVLALAASHGVSFVLNYLRSGEYQQARLFALMQAPYGRVVLLHVAILGGGFLIMGLGSPVWALALLVFLKIGLDVRAHLRERRRFAADTAGRPPVKPG